MNRVISWFHANRFVIGLFLGLLVLNVVVYRGALSIGFLSDDYHVLAVVRAWSHPFRAFVTNIAGETTGSSYGPIFTFLTWVGYRLFGMNPLGYHIGTIFLHVISATCVGIITHYLTGRRAIGVLAAVCFSLFHTRVEVLFWLSSFPHLFATCMMTLSLYAWLRYRGEGHHRWWWISVLTFACGLFTKEVIILLPVFIALMLFVSFKRLRWKDLRQAGITMLPYMITIGVYLLLRAKYTGITLGGYGERGIITNIRHLSRLLVEITTNLFVAQPYRDFLGGWSVTHAFLVVIGIVGVIFVSWRVTTYRPALQFGVLGYLVMIFVFLQLLMHPITDEGERYTYLVSVFAAIWLSTIVYRWYRHHPLKIGIVIGLFFFVQLWFISTKAVHWQQADALARKIVSSITDETFVGDPAFIIGLPDHVSGAQVFRNGFREAVWLERGIRTDIDVIPLYSALADITQSEVFVRATGDDAYELRGVGGRRGFTGFSKWDRPYGRFALAEFELRGHTGTRIRMDLSDHMRDEEIEFLFVDQGKITSAQRELHDR